MQVCHIRAGMLFVHKPTGNLYITQGETIKMKNPETRKWLTAVLYSPANMPDTLYCREARDFLETFERQTWSRRT